MGVATLVLAATVVVLVWLYVRWRHSYWASRGVNSPPSLPFIGHMHKNMFTGREHWKFYDEAYNKYGGSTFCGLYEFFKPILVIGDLELMKLILVKDFDHFTDRRYFEMGNSERDRVISEMLSIRNGAEWKNLRTIMSPAFTSGKFKSMFPIVCEKADVLVNCVMKTAAKENTVAMKKKFGSFTMDTIASCAFGIECNSLEDENAQFPRKADPFFNVSTKAMIKILFFLSMPKLCKALGISANPPETNFFIDVVNKTVAAREAGQKRGDFLDLLLEARSNTDKDKQVLTDICLVAQSVLFLVVGYDTTANALSFATFLLAKHKNQQQRVRAEVQEIVAQHGSLTYQGVMEAKLLDACMQETLRIYPPLPVTERSCSKTYKLPGTALTLHPGDLVQIPIWSVHHDPRYWPDPEKFIIDRFLPENKGNIKSFTHLPFGMGPRNCIAMRFALLEAKVALAKLLLAAELEAAPGHEEMFLETGGGLMRPKASLEMLVKPIREE